MMVKTAYNNVTTQDEATTPPLALGGASTTNAIHNKRKMSEKIEAIKLDFMTIGNPNKLYGRKQELESITNVCNNIFEDTTSAYRGECIILHGKAGAGKTALIEHCREEWSDRQNFFYARAKFDVPASTSDSRATASSSNLDPIARACADLCDAIRASPQCEVIRKQILESLGRRLTAFQDFVPNSKQLLSIQHDTGAANDDDNVVIREERGFARLKVLISQFLQAICSCSSTPDTPSSKEGTKRNVVALFLDDVQWADDGCLELLHFLAIGKQNGLLLIVAHRDEELQPDSNLAMQLSRLEQEIHVTKIHIHELDMVGVNEIISGLTQRPLDETMPLAEVVYEKTRGNPFFVIQLLRSIEEEGYLYFSAKSLRWKWDLETIESLTQISDNVVEFVTQKIQRLPGSAQAALKIAAYCLGSTIHVRIVDYLATSTAVFSNCLADHDVVDRQKAWMDIFDSLANEGLVNKRRKGSRTYVWSHDRILESAYRLVPSAEDQKRIHLQIGEALRKMVDCPFGESWKLVTATEQLNRASSILMEDDAQRVDLAQMNLIAGKAVARTSAFHQAARYLKTGVDFLDKPNAWEADYELSLELHNSLAEMERYIGHHDACRMAAKEVLLHGRNLSDQFRSYIVMIDSLGARGEYRELMDLSFDLTGRLGDPLPRQPTKLRLMFEVLRANHMLGKRTDEELLDMSAIVDERVLQLSCIYNRLHRLTWAAGKIPLTIFIRVRMMQLFLRHGCNEFSGPTLALYGSILARLGKLDQAYRFGLLALRFCERFPVEETQTSIYVFMHLMVIKKPLSHSIEPLRQAHRTGLEKGDHVVTGALAYCVFYMYQGLPLAPMHEDARAFAIHLLQTGNEILSTYVNAFRQLAHNFMGRSDNFLVLSGEAIDLEKVERRAVEQKNHVMLLFLWTTQLLLACFSFDHDLSVAMFQNLEKADLLPEFFPGPAILGLVSVFLARSTGVRKYVRRAMSVKKQLNALLKKGSVNYLLFLFLLKAELAVIQKKKELATKSFEAAVRAAAQSGFANFGALASERYGLYALERDGGDTYWAETHLSRAVFLYSEWGAQAKVDSITRKFPFVSSAPTRTERRRSTHHIGGRRLDLKNLNDSRKVEIIRFHATEEDDYSLQFDGAS
jgi:predicted ATPase